MVNQNIAAVIPADRALELAEILARVGAGERIQHYETVRLHKDGSILDVSVTISPIFDGGGEVVGVSTIARDITRQKRVQELLAHRALHDALTNLPNRVLLRDRIEGALARAERHGTGIAVFFWTLTGSRCSTTPTDMLLAMRYSESSPTVCARRLGRMTPSRASAVTSS
jgi:PAS domain-containing protein